MSSGSAASAPPPEAGEPCCFSEPDADLALLLARGALPFLYSVDEVLNARPLVGEAAWVVDHVAAIVACRGELRSHTLRHATNRQYPREVMSKAIDW